MITCKHNDERMCMCSGSCDKCAIMRVDNDQKKEPTQKILR